MGLFSLFKRRESETIVESPKKDFTQKQIQKKK